MLKRSLNIADITNHLKGARVFTKIDLLKGYFQVPVAKKERRQRLSPPSASTRSVTAALAFGTSLTWTTDASNMAMGVVLLGFFSKKLMVAEQKYSKFDRELLAIHKPICHFHHMIEGWQFVIQMNHQPLVHNKNHRRMIRIAYPEIGEAEKEDVDLQRLWKDNPTLMWSDKSINNREMTITCKTGTGHPRPYLSAGLRRRPQPVPPIRLYNCLNCSGTRVESRIGEVHTTHLHLAHIYIDKVGLLPPSEGYRYLFTIIYRNTKWPEAIPIWQQMAESCVKALMGWVSRHGVPQDITSDRGANFTSSLWYTLIDSFWTKIVHMMAYNPEANGIIEKLH
ncbi:uncharacterized protein [Macrobrachium rosenbergii]|uniref:uncharacterized protein n=1 Tax=Macrobrachium rosenbergii TaxID=79674 RepID=UPI0034D45E5C